MTDRKWIWTVCWRLECASRFVSLSFAFLLVIYFSFLFVSIFIHFSSVLIHPLWFPLNSGGRMELDLCTKAKYYYIRLFLYSPEILKQTYITLYWKMENEEEKKEYIVLLVYFLFFFQEMDICPRQRLEDVGQIPSVNTKMFWSEFREDWPQLALIINEINLKSLQSRTVHQFCCVFKHCLSII